MYQWLDRAPKGRNENSVWWRHHDSRIAREETERRSHAAGLGATGWLGLAAAPTFAVMALLTYVTGGDADMMGSAAHGMSSLSGVVPMYLLMGAFHSAPWLKLICGRWEAIIRANKLASYE
jgi:hypothetical protein